MIYDFISLCPIIFTIYSIFIKDFKLLFGISLISSIQYIIKYSIKYFNIKNKIFLRPENACDCNSFNNGGNVGLEPGFPSGHVALTTFFVNYMFFRKYSGDYFALFFLNFIPLIIGISRYEKKCHNIWQTLSGYLLAIILLIFFL